MRFKFVFLFYLLLAACSSPSARVTQFTFNDIPTLATTGNLRLVTERQRLEQDGTYWPIVCTEPSPDYAVTFNTLAEQSAKMTASDKGTGEAQSKISTTETALQLAGRTASILALRDGLYAVCQSYVNGVIGHDAYAMILSQYGDLLVALVGNNNANEATVASPSSATRSKGVSTVKSKGNGYLTNLLVTCISQYDTTRHRGRDNGSSNALLSLQFCRKVLNDTLRLATARS
ncbi:hypothetical protein [Beijerinckia mobilis]|uniref:hypothetical protein n=1 Tax=Beijerinckia mobilis TaxID=231434 RepID=UPI00054D001D|nr:hypothetical protein [Beijerinckia mobilis]